MCYFCKYITLCCRCCLSVVRTWRKRWRNSRTASHHWSTDSGMCVPTASPPPYWWSRLPTRSVRLSNLGLTGQTVIGRFACYWLNSLSLGGSCFICWWFGEKESMLYMFVCLFQGWTKEKIKLQLENSYLLDSDDIDVFTVDSTMSDVVLINGVYLITSTCRTLYKSPKG